MKLVLVKLSDRLEDQPYFHGVMPRTQTITLLTEKGDYLIRINNQDKIVLSILWPDASNKLKDGHYFIHQIPKDNVRIKRIFILKRFNINILLDVRISN